MWLSCSCAVQVTHTGLACVCRTPLESIPYWCCASYSHRLGLCLSHASLEYTLLVLCKLLAQAWLVSVVHPSRVYPIGAVQVTHTGLACVCRTPLESIPYWCCASYSHRLSLCLSYTSREYTLLVLCKLLTQAWLVFVAHLSRVYPIGAVQVTRSGLACVCLTPLESLHR